jgi:aminoglycoside phosphotransferase (APT) family kinase protein
MLVSQTETDSDEYQRLKALQEDFERMCRELASFGIPATLHHDDFHDGNLFLLNGRVIFTDWGESAVTHPFFTLVVLLRGASNSLDLEPDAPELAQVRDWYLSQWTDYAPLAELQRVVRLAQRIGLVNRALTWHRVISYLPESLKPEYAMAT